MSRRVESGGNKYRFVETQTGRRGPFSVEVHETGFNRDKEEDFTTLRVSMTEPFMKIEGHKTELMALLNGIDKSANEFGSTTEPGRWKLELKINPLVWKPYLEKRFVFPVK